MNPPALFASARFLASAAGARQMPPAGPPEICFAGRSNAGKSTAINALCGRERLAFASKTPGRTQLINFFALARKDEEHRLIDLAYLVDLPGYGFARAPEATRRSWGALIGAYLAERASLIGAVLLLDARRPFTPADEWVIGFFAERSHVRQLWLLNKCDQLGQAERQTALRLAERRAEQNGATVQLFSGRKRFGLGRARETIVSWLGLAETVN